VRRQNTLWWAATGGALGLILFSAWNERDAILLNSTPSAPIGLYVRIDAPVEPGAFVTVRARDVAPPYARLRRFDDPGDRFIKRVRASAGDNVCAAGDSVQIGEATFRRRTHDRAGRALPTWEGCRRLAANEVVLIGDGDDSFDSRYFGVVRLDQIEGVWRPL
jgi:conjugative transfer signal peptidase TraF